MTVIGILMIIWNSSLDENEMKDLEVAWPDQHKYVKTNMLYYLVSIISFAVSCIGGVNDGLAGCFICGLGIWSIYVFIWNLTCQSVVYDEVWLADQDFLHM